MAGEVPPADRARTTRNSSEIVPVAAAVVETDRDATRIDPDPVPAAEPPHDRYPINLAAALELAGSSSLQVAYAQERVREAHAKLQGAKVLWVPNLSAGIGFNDHAGQLQDIQGRIIEINRQSLFVGGGAAFGNSPLAGGANPPARLGVDLSPVDVIFEPLAARQTVQRLNADAAAVFNDAMRDVSLAYLELVRAQADLAIAGETIANLEELAQLTGDFARTGAGLQADARRAAGALSGGQQRRLAAEEHMRVASAQLSRLLRLDQSVGLYAIDAQPVPLVIVPPEVPMESLITQSMQSRPEIARQASQVRATESRVAQERWRPWVPNLHVGVGGGTFGGGRNDDFGDFSGRYDLDAAAVWEVRNLGFGNRSLVRERASQHQQACIAYYSARDQVAAEVAAAYHEATLRLQQIEPAQQQITAAADALPLNFNGIRGGELRPIEAQQAIAALAEARGNYVDAVIGYNQAQLALWRSVGQAPDAAIGMQSFPDSANAPAVPPATGWLGTSGASPQ